MTEQRLRTRETEPGVRRVRSLRPYAAVFFIAVGLVVCWGIELGRYWIQDKRITLLPIFLGGVLGFIGFYLLDHKDAKDAATFIFDRGITLLRTVRPGRATDPPGTVVETTVAKDEEGVK